MYILGKVEDSFSKLCCQINKKLLKLLVKTGEAKCQETRARKSKAKKKTGESTKKTAKAVTKASNVSYEIEVFRLAQQKNLDGLITAEFSASEGERVGVIALIQVLNMEMETKLRVGVTSKEARDFMYQELVNKTANAKYSDEFRAYREAHIQSVAGKKMRKALTLEPI